MLIFCVWNDPMQVECYSPIIISTTYDNVLRGQQWYLQTSRQYKHLQTIINQCYTPITFYEEKQCKFAQLSVNQNVSFSQCHLSTCSAVSLLLSNFSASNQLDTLLQSDDKLRSIISSPCDELGSLYLHG